MKWLKRIGFAILIILALIAILAFVQYQLTRPKSISYSTIKEELSTSNIPVVFINTKKDISNDKKIDGQLEIKIKDSSVLSHKMNIKFRGKTSYYFSNKKSYSFDFCDAKNKEVELEVLGMAKDEDWILIGNVVMGFGGDIWDKTMLFNHIGYELSRNANRYASNTRFVELIVNDEYMGLYTLGEKLKQGKNRISIKENKGDSTLQGGYIIAIDKAEPLPSEITKSSESDMSNDYHYTRSACFKSQYNIDGNSIIGNEWNKNKPNEIYYNYVYPKPTKITVAQRKYISNYIHQFESAILKDDFNKPTRSYTDYIDLPSFVDFFIVNELCKNIDAYRLSTYMHKDQNGKLNMGPVWDMNIGFHDGDRLEDTVWVVDYNRYVTGDHWAVPFYWPRLMKDPLFMQEVKSRWKSLRESSFSDKELLSLINNNSNYLIKNNAIKRNYKKWDKRGKINYGEEIESLKKFIIRRATWMDSKLK